MTRDPQTGSASKTSSDVVYLADLSATPAVPTAMRLPLTVMFCDLVGSTELSQALDPEQVMEIVLNYFDQCTQIIESAGGMVARYMGDGVLAYFGFPAPGEQDAERAVRAARSLVEAIPQLDTGTEHRLAIRIGIATGPTVTGTRIGKGVSAEILTIGNAPNVASRLQSLAQANQIVVDDETRLQTASKFPYAGLPLTKIKGVKHKIRPNLCVIDEQPLRAALTSAHYLDETGNLAKLVRRIADPGNQSGGCIAISGPDGAGKSAFVRELQVALETSGLGQIELCGSDIFRNSQFHAIRAALPAAAGGAGALAGSALAVEQLKQQFRSHCQTIAAAGKLVLVLEDVDKIDPSSIELIKEFRSSSDGLALWTITTSASACAMPFTVAEQAEAIAIKGLSRPALITLIGQQVPSISAALAEQIAQRSGGIPYFALELAKHHAEAELRGQVSELPPTLTQVLLARLSRAGATMQTVQCAAVLGDGLSLQTLQNLTDENSETISRDVARLEQAGILTRLGQGAQTTFSFSHTLLRQAAYESLLVRRRREYHRRAAEYFAANLTVAALAQYDVVAQHWHGAGEDARAQKAWEQAAQQAITLDAYCEAQTAFENALQLLRGRASGVVQAGDEIILQSGLGNVLQVTEGYASPKALSAMAKARTLAATDSGGADLFSNLVGLWGGASSAGDYVQSQLLMGQILPVAMAMGNDLSLAVAHMIQLTTLYRVGQIAMADRMFRNGERYFAHGQFVAHPGSIAQTYGNGALIAWLLGDLQEADRRLALVEAQASGGEHPYIAAFAASMAATISHLLGRHDAALALAATAFKLSTENNYPQFLATSQVVSGSALCATGRTSAGIRKIRAGIRAMAQSRAKAGMSMYLSWLAEAQIAAGQPDAASRTIRKALAEFPLEQFYHSELLRLSARLAVLGGDAAAAKVHLEMAAASASAMGAITLAERVQQDMRMVSVRRRRRVENVQAEDAR